MLATQDFTKEFEAQVLVAEMIERIAEAAVASYPTISLIEWKIDTERVLAMSQSVTKQASLLREHQLIGMAA